MQTRKEVFLWLDAVIFIVSVGAALAWFYFFMNFDSVKQKIASRLRQ